MRVDQSVPGDDNEDEEDCREEDGEKADQAVDCPEILLQLLTPRGIFFLKHFLN